MPQNQIRWFAPGGETDPVSLREFKALSKQGQGALAAKLKRLKKAENKTPKQELDKARQRLKRWRGNAGTTGSA